MGTKRTARLNEQLRRELTTLIRSEVRDPRVGDVSVTDVEVSPDLYHARVFYSIMGDEPERDSAAEGLRAAAGFLRSEIGKRLHIRRSPELHFTYDDTIQHAMRIERLLAEARASSATSGAQEAGDDRGTDESHAAAGGDAVADDAVADDAVADDAVADDAVAGDAADRDAAGDSVVADAAAERTVIERDGD